MNSDHTIANWMNNFAINEVSIFELELDSSNLSNYMRDYELKTNIKSDVIEEPVCQSFNLGTNEISKVINEISKVINGIIDIKLKN